jgi:polyphosphate kinase
MIENAMARARRKPKRTTGLTPIKKPTDLPTASMYVNRELSWLEFNKRVLAQAFDTEVPVLERLRFLGIFHANLDEFFMKRVGLLRRNLILATTHISRDGMTAAQQFFAIRKTVMEMEDQANKCFKDLLTPELKKEGIFLLKWKDLSGDEKERAKQIFETRIFPILTPLSVDPGHPFPFISNLSYSLAVALRHPGKDERLFSRVKLPEIFPAWIDVTTDQQKPSSRWVHISEIVLNNLTQLFPDMEIIATLPFRITRNIEVERNEENFDDLLQMIEEELRERKFEDVVKLEHGPNPDEWLLKFLMHELDVMEHDLYQMDSEIDYAGLKPIWSINRPQLQYPQWNPLVPPELIEEGTDIFRAISQKDILVHHPYESFSASVERFIRSAAEDSKVLAIKMTLYRTPEESTIAQSLIKAADLGKQVVCLVELKARFDEKRNIAWATRMEDAGIHVVYGVLGLKTHCKVLLVVRQEADGLKTYCHIGTGNYHPFTARTYTDVGLFTINKEISEDVIALFNYLTGRSLKKDYKKLLVAPINMKKTFLDFIQREIDNKKANKEAHVVIKCNNLEDHDLVNALYAASAAGVKIDLIVRSICTLRPGVKDLSSNIRVISIVDQLLEHSRIFYFRNAASDPAKGEMFIGSADCMYRNLLARVEVVVPIEELSLKAKIWEILDISLKCTGNAWIMQMDGSYQRASGSGAKTHSAQRELMRLTRDRIVHNKG